MNPNPQLSFLQQANLMIARTRGAGLTPLYFLMNAVTNGYVAQELATAAEARRSALGRIIARLRGDKSKARLQALLTLPVIDAPNLPDGVILLQHSGVIQPVPQAGTMGEAAGKVSYDPHAPMPQFQARERVTPEAPGNPKLDDLIGTGEHVTPTDILIKGMEGIERIKQVLVIRVFDNNDVDMSLNCNAFEAAGILEKARMWLHMRGD